jgi:Cu/Ag efflux pump CusA
VIDAVLHWSLSHRGIVLALAALLLGWGVATAVRMPVDVFPDLTAPTVTVITEAHSMAPEELEVRVTFPIEAALNGAPAVRRVRSSTGVGISLVYVEFDWGTDIFRARQVVSEKLALVRSTLPAEVEEPALAPVSSIMGEIMFLALRSTSHSPMEQRTVADFTIRRKLLAVPGVSQVIVTGGEVKQFQVVLNPQRLALYRIPAEEVVRALQSTNGNVSAGFIVEHSQEYLVHGVGRVRTTDDVAETFVTEREGVPVYVRNLGTVQLGASPKRGEGSFRGGPAVIIGVQKQPGTNTLQLTERLDHELDTIQSGLPKGMKIERGIFRQADFIQVAIDNVKAALRDGVVLV